MSGANTYGSVCDSPSSWTPRVRPQTSMSAQRGSVVRTPLKNSMGLELLTRQKTRPFLSTQKATRLPSLASSSGSALAQNPFWDTRSGHAYLGRLSGLMRDGSLEVKPRRRAPLQQHCFFVICTASKYPQLAFFLLLLLTLQLQITVVYYNF